MTPPGQHGASAQVSRSAPRVKICGITCVADATAAVEAGADYIGVVFAERVRRLDPARAASVIEAVEGRVRGVGVFVDADIGEVLDHRATVGFEVAKLHGAEEPEACTRLRAQGLEVWKAIRPRSPEALVEGFDRYAAAVDGILIEGFSGAAAGGTGTSFPHAWLEGVDRDGGPKVILAGGLNAENVAVAIEAVRPDVVDVSSSVESSPGIKSVPKIEAFIEAVRATSKSSEYEEE